MHESPTKIARRIAGPPEGPADRGQLAAYGNAMTAGGVLRRGSVLAAREAAMHDSTSAVADEACGKTSLPPGGYFVIDVPDRQTALDWAARDTAARHGGRIDVHAAFPAPTMP